MENCEYLFRCPYERKTVDFVCQHQALAVNCGFYQNFKQEEQKAREESGLEVKTRKNEDLIWD